jgi:predicted nucleic acid-binding protein
MRQIPPLRSHRFADLFREAERYDGETRPELFDYVPDPADRKFAALAEATGATLVTSDNDLLERREQSSAPIMTPAEFTRRHQGDA